MSAKHEPSLLEYARFHGIARDYTAINPSEQPDQSLELPPDDPSVSDGKLKSLDKYLLTTQETVEKAIREEKLNVRKDDVRLLSAVLRDVRTHEFEFHLEDQLAAFRRLDKLRLEPPIFSLDYETRSALPRSPVLYNAEGLDLAPLEEVPEYQFGTLLKKADEINETIRNEKLNCTKQSFMLIQNAMKLGNVSSNHLDDILANSIRLVSILGSVEQQQTDLILTSHRQSLSVRNLLLLPPWTWTTYPSRVPRLSQSFRCYPALPRPRSQKHRSHKTIRQ
jgi:hypothetical protein